jgi:hypothetical protein
MVSIKVTSISTKLSKVIFILPLDEKDDIDIIMEHKIWYLGMLNWCKKCWRFEHFVKARTIIHSLIIKIMNALKKSWNESG